MKYLKLAKNDEVKYWVEHNLKNYLEKNQENVSEIEHIIDFLHSDYAPKRLRKMSYKEANESAKRWVKTLMKKGANLEVVEDVDYDVVIDFGDGFTLVKLKSELAFQREGNLMAHCVGSYFNKESDIYSLWDSKGMPHCTLEILEGAESFNQCKGKSNGPIHYKYIKYILETMKRFKIDMRDSEMYILGYFRPESSNANKDQIAWFKQQFKNLETLKLGNKVYYYVGQY